MSGPLVLPVFQGDLELFLWLDVAGNRRGSQDQLVLPNPAVGTNVNLGPLSAYLYSLSAYSYSQPLEFFFDVLKKYFF